jgi:UDP:flavonoid glycosyltransferase YjiC (YdhE family)
MMMLTGSKPELEAYGRQFHNQGLGIHMPGDRVTPDDVARCASDMTNNLKLRNSVKLHQRSVRAGSGAEEVLNWLEDKRLL